MKLEPEARLEGIDISCGNAICPLNQVKIGLAVRIKQLCATPAVADRLREIGFCEDRIVRLLAGHGNFICQVCNSRLALSEQLARAIMVEPVVS
jgi:Fe2+ transport system protein FeoA